MTEIMIYTFTRTNTFQACNRTGRLSMMSRTCQCRRPTLEMVHLFTLSGDSDSVVKCVGSRWSLAELPAGHNQAQKNQFGPPSPLILMWVHPHVQL